MKTVVRRVQVAGLVTTVVGDAPLFEETRDLALVAVVGLDCPNNVAFQSLVPDLLQESQSSAKIYDTDTSVR